MKADMLTNFFLGRKYIWYSMVAVIVVVLLLIALLSLSEQQQEDMGIIVSNIESGTVIDKPLTVIGSARGMWFVNGAFPIRLYDAQNNLLGEAEAVALENWKTEDLIPFQAIFSYIPSNTIRGELRMYNNGKSDSETEVYVLPVKFGEKKTSLYYLDKNDPCGENSLVSVTRYIPGENDIQETLKLLLDGELREEEKEQGIHTQFPDSQFSLTDAQLDGGTLTLSFTRAPAFTSGSACHVRSLRAQIETTAKQFFGVREVIYSPEIFSR